jgi:hypothetical protein
MFADIDDRQLSRLIPDIQTRIRYFQNLTALVVYKSVTAKLRI